jgi:hypothetical protein
MNLRHVVGFALIGIGSVSLVYADNIVSALPGSCRITASTKENEIEIRLQRTCAESADCGEQTITQPIAAWSGITLADLNRVGSHIVAVLHAEAGTMTCNGTVRDQTLVGDYTFQPNQAFVARMGSLGITGLTAEKLQAYTLFRIDSAWVQSLQQEGITGINASNLIAMKIFNVEPAYVESLKSLGYSVPSAQKLIALRVHKVDPAEIRQIRALGYEPTLDQMVQMRIFKVTPEFIERMRSRGINNLTISKLVQIRIFKLDE